MVALSSGNSKSNGPNNFPSMSNESANNPNVSLNFVESIIITGKPTVSLKVYTGVSSTTIS